MTDERRNAQFAALVALCGSLAGMIAAVGLDMTDVVAITKMRDELSTMRKALEVAERLIGGER
jgi:hypothetical protein